MSNADHAMPTPGRLPRRGFTLIELLTVVFIIAILIAILLPVLGSVQNSGRQASTQSLLVELNNAAASFQLDNRRQPGYFSQSEIGSELNFDAGDGGPGLTALENALLDLSGVGAIATEEPADPDAWVEVNPTDDTARRIWVKADLLGANEGNYFIPGQSALAHMTAQQQPGTITATQPPASTLPDGLPDLIDAFGQPVLAWVEDETGPRNIRSAADFASVYSESGSSRFYWAANGSMLASNSLGERGRSMTLPPTQNTDGSLIGSGAVERFSEDQIRGVMAALLGNPGFPDEANLANGNYDALFPTQARGGFVAHSAGQDGIYLGSDDTRFARVVGSGMFGGGDFNITYGITYFGSTGGDRRRGDDGQPVARDFIEGFDDLLVAQ